jgi:hypothetical protein
VVAALLDHVLIAPGEPGRRPFDPRRLTPVWRFYYGAVDPAVADFRSVYSFLQDALQTPDPLLPVRAHDSSKWGACAMKPSGEGALASFRGHETIFDRGRELCSAAFVGGLIDSRRERTP